MHKIKFLGRSIGLLGMMHIFFNALESAMKDQPEWLFLELDDYFGGAS